MTANVTNTDSLVELVARHNVQCATQASVDALGSTVTLGPLDHPVASFIPVAVVYVYEASPSTASEIIPLGRLQRSLARVLDFYPHLTGRLRIDDMNGTRSLIRLGTGIDLLETRCNAPLDRFRSPDHDNRLLITDLPGGGNALLAPFDTSPASISSEPVLTVQHTRFACGGISLGIRLLHTITDADGYFQFVRDLAKIYRGIRDGGPGTLVRPPHIRAYLAELCENMSPEDRQAALAFEPQLFYAQEPGRAEDGGLVGSSTTAPGTDPPPVVGRIMRFTGSELAALKSHATDPAGTGWVSTFDALVAHVHQRVYLARLQLPGTTPDTLSHDFLASINLRPNLLAAELPPPYFPNALMTPYATLPHEQLADAPLWRVAKWIHDLTRVAAPAAVHGTTGSPENARATVRWIAAQPDKRSIRQRFDYRPGSFMASQWCKFRMYAGADFDVDARGASVLPALVAPPFTPISLVDGLVYFLATQQQFHGEEGAADIDVCLALSEPLWPILDSDEEFRKFRQAL